MKSHVLAALLLTCATAANADQSIANGRYVAQFGDGNCGLVVAFNGKFDYIYANTCAGGKPVGVIYDAKNVHLKGKTLHVDDATLLIASKTATEFSGIWTLSGRSFQVTFSKQ